MSPPVACEGPFRRPSPTSSTSRTLRLRNPQESSLLAGVDARGGSLERLAVQSPTKYWAEGDVLTVRTQRVLPFSPSTFMGKRSGHSKRKRRLRPARNRTQTSSPSGWATSRRTLCSSAALTKTIVQRFAFSSQKTLGSQKLFDLTSKTGAPPFVKVPRSAVVGGIGQRLRLDAARIVVARPNRDHGGIVRSPESRRVAGGHVDGNGSEKTPYWSVPGIATPVLYFTEGRWIRRAPRHVPQSAPFRLYW